MAQVDVLPSGQIDAPYALGASVTLRYRHAGEMQGRMWKM